MNSAPRSVSRRSVLAAAMAAPLAIAGRKAEATGLIDAPSLSRAPEVARVGLPGVRYLQFVTTAWREYTKDGGQFYDLDDIPDSPWELPGMRWFSTIENEFDTDEHFDTRLDLLRIVYRNNKGILDAIGAEEDGSTNLDSFDGWFIPIEIGEPIEKILWTVQEDRDDYPGLDDPERFREMHVDRLCAELCTKFDASFITPTAEEIATIEAELA